MRTTATGGTERCLVLGNRLLLRLRLLSQHWRVVLGGVLLLLWRGRGLFVFVYFPVMTRAALNFF